jgi:hypothetical protein
MQDADRETGSSTPAQPGSMRDTFKKDQSQGPNEPRDEQGRKRSHPDQNTAEDLHGSPNRSAAPAQSTASDWDMNASKSSGRQMDAKEQGRKENPDDAETAD